MPAKWTTEQKSIFTTELKALYVDQNKSIREISEILNMSESGVYGRLLNCNIPIRRNLKPNYNNQRILDIPPRSVNLAEFIGIMLGDGNINKYQIIVTLGTKEISYSEYVSELMNKLFQVQSRIIVSPNNYRSVYFGSRRIVLWLLEMGLAYNKVAAQVKIPQWCFEDCEYMKALLRGLIDTDGSIYKLKFGVQISFTNKSIPLLKGAQVMLQYLGYSPSRISCNKLYLTKKPDIIKYYREIGFKNIKHVGRFNSFMSTGSVVEWSNTADCQKGSSNENNNHLMNFPG